MQDTWFRGSREVAILLLLFQLSSISPGPSCTDDTTSRRAFSSIDCGTLQDVLALCQPWDFRLHIPVFGFRRWYSGDSRISIRRLALASYSRSGYQLISCADVSTRHASADMDRRDRKCAGFGLDGEPLAQQQNRQDRARERGAWDG